MNEPQVRRLVGGQIIRSGRHGHYVITREAVAGMLEQLRERPVPVNIEHDPTEPPIGRVVGGNLVEVEDGELALETEIEIFTGTWPAALYPVSRLDGLASDLPAIEIEKGPLELLIDDRSYSPDDLEALRQVAATAGDVDATDGAVRFSQLPDALLILSLGSAATAAWWFSKGFFSKLGERVGDELGAEVGADLVAAYRALKLKLREVVQRRQPPDRPPLTMLRLEVDRPGQGVVCVEGSTRADGEGLDDLLDGGQELLIVARVYMRLVPEPERLTTLHFSREDGCWRFRYGLDEDAHPVLVVALSEERFAELLAQAERESASTPRTQSLPPPESL